jgi:hypothetical protein
VFQAPEITLVMAAAQFVSGIGMIVDCEGEITGSALACSKRAR